MVKCASDDALFPIMRQKLFTAVVGDAMDRLEGLTHTPHFLPPQIRPLRDDTVVVGRAMTVLEANCTGADVTATQVYKPFGLMLEALDHLAKNDVYICTGPSPTFALWGENMTTRAVKLGAAGAVLDGFSRDTKGILHLGFPTFSWGPYARDQGIRGRVIDYGCPLTFANGVIVQPGDVVFGDIDGVLIIPKDQLETVVDAAMKRVQGEKHVLKALNEGMSAVEAFTKYGVM